MPVTRGGSMDTISRMHRHRFFLSAALLSRLRNALPVVCVLCLLPQLAFAELRPLVPVMIDNLGSINRIGRAVALEDFAQVEKSSQELIARADALRELNLETVDIDPKLDAAWDSFLMTQRIAAEGVITAAKAEDAIAVMVATQNLFGNSCLGCHAVFRDPARLLRTEVHVMTGFLSAWQDVNRGLALNDYNLIALRSRDLATLTGLIATDEMLEDAFGIGGPTMRRKFRGFLFEVTTNANQIEEAAKQENLPVVLEATRNMWTNGCLACHAKFRN